MSDQAYDVVVVSAENAALCTAISAKLESTHVLVLEKAPEDEKGGNFYFTAGGFRFTHTDLNDVCQDVHVDLSGEHARGRYTAVAE